MSPETYFIDILLIALVLRQMITRPLTTRAAVLPVILIAWAWLSYFKSFSPGGDDLELVGLFTAAGAVLGTTSALATRVWPDGDRLMFRAGLTAAVAWIAGMGFRLGFQIWASSASGEASIARFSVRHDITSAQAWVSALLLMAVAEVLTRVGVLQWRLFSFERRRAGALATDEAIDAD